MNHKKFVLAAFLIISLSFLHSGSFADDITLRDGSAYMGRIIDVTEKGILFEALMKGSICVFSFDEGEIKTVKLETVVFPKNLFEIRKSPFEIRVNKDIFDEIFLEKGYSFFGTVEMETREGVYFSLLLERGIAIVEFERGALLGLQGSYGLKRALSKMYFWWRYFVYDMRDMKRKLVYKLNRSTVGDVPLYDWEKQREEEDIKKLSGGRKVLSRETLKALATGQSPLGEEERYKKGVESGFLVLGMPEEDVVAVMGRPGKKYIIYGEESLVFENDTEVFLNDGRLAGYRKKSRERIVNDVRKFLKGKVVK